MSAMYQTPRSKNPYSNRPSRPDHSNDPGYSNHPKPPTSPQEDISQTHDHEFLGSVKLAEEGDDRHNHRVAGVTSEVIPLPGGGHKHGLLTNTDFFINHHHELAAETGPAIPVGGGKHVHLISTRTTIDDGHFHEVFFTTLIEDPLD